MYDIPRAAYLLLFVLMPVGCKTAPTEEPPEVRDPEMTRFEGLWGGSSTDPELERLACLKIVEPDQAAAFEMVEVNGSNGSGLIVSAEGRWTYRARRVEVELDSWPDSRGVPTLTAEMGGSRDVMLLRVVFRQGGQFTVAMERSARCGGLVG